MSKSLFTAVAAVLGLGVLAGCHHHRPAETYTPVVETTPPEPEPVRTSKYR